MYAPLRCKRRLEDNDGLASAVQLPRRDDNNHAFLIKPVFCRKQVERINAAGPQPPQAPATAAMQRCLAVRPDLADGVRSGPRQTMEEDLFFTRPAHGYFGPALQSWDDRRTGTPLYRIDQFLLTAFQNPLIGAHLSVPPRQRVEVEVILRDPTIVEPHKRFARDNIVAIRDRRSLLDESARPGHYVLAEIWYGQYSDGRLPRSSLVERAYLLHVLARADVRHVVKHAPGVAAYGRTVNELAMKALSEIANNRALERADVKLRKAQARDEHRGSHADIQRAYNTIEREHQSSRRASEEAVVKRAIRSRIQTRRGDGGGRLTSVRDYAELVLDTTELGESERYWLVEQFCNLDHADCPANPVRVLSFQRSVDALLELCPGLAGSPQLDYANYVYAENGVRMFPYPDLVFTIDACDFTPERLQRRLLPWH